MKSMLELQTRLVPDLLDVMRKRYEVLRYLQLMQPVGRRNLATALGMTERVLRSEVNFLKDRGLVRVESVGMQVTPTGQDLLSDLEPFINEMMGITELERGLARVLDLQQAVVIPGDSDHSDSVKKEMGRAGARLLKQTAQPDQVVAVGGGTTVAAVARMMTASTVLKDTTFVPARGGLGEAVELEANYLASLMAQKAGGRYRLMHVPEQLSAEAHDTLVREPHIQEVLRLLRSARIVVHGIGDATTMAARRKSSPALLAELERKGAVGEAFGFYFDRAGSIVHRGRSIGLSFEDLKNVDTAIAIAGGAGKAEAVAAVCSVSRCDILITDEAAARAILKKVG